jgi:hypothetical protein
MPYRHVDNRPFTLNDARRVQREDLERQRAVLKPEVYSELAERIAAASAGVTNPWDLPRGQDVTSAATSLAYEAYHSANIEFTMHSGLTFDMPKEAAVALSRPGKPADMAVAFWQPKLRQNLAHLTFEEIMAELVEHDCWDAKDLLDRPTNEGRLLWLAACRANEDGELDL